MMKKSRKKTIGIVFVCLTLVLATVSFSTAVNNDTIYVDDDGTADYTNIQDAIDAASDGDTIFVYSGVYYENLILDKSIILQGEDKTSTVIDGGKQDHVIEVFAEHVTISDFTIQNGSDNGIHLPSSYTIIENNIIQNNEDSGIYLDSTYPSKKAPSHNTIIGNIIRNNGNGISIWGGAIHLGCIHIQVNAVDNTIKSNIIQNNNHGIYLAADTAQTVIELNQFDNNEISVAPMHTVFNKITKNNFLGSDPFFQSGINEWNENYWGQPLDAPKRIIGRIGYFGIVPWFNFDENPAQEPYDIP